jgi:hypothetical protein
MIHVLLFFPLWLIYIGITLSETIDQPIIRTIALIGDSLIERSSKNNDLLGKLNKLTSPNISYTQYGSNGAKIATILEKLPTVLATNPDVVILFWDSDCSDINEKTMSNKEIIQLRNNFTTNLKFVIKNVLKTGALMAVSGPGVLGEGPFGKPTRFWGKDTMLDDYRSIVKTVTLSYKLEYLDIRQAFLNSYPIFKFYYKGTITKDGEHENETGTKIIANIFANFINKM